MKIVIHNNSSWWSMVEGVVVYLIAVNVDGCVKCLANLTIEFHSWLKSEIHAIQLG